MEELKIYLETNKQIKTVLALPVDEESIVFVTEEKENDGEENNFITILSNGKSFSREVTGLKEILNTKFDDSPIFMDELLREDSGEEYKEIKNSGFVALSILKDDCSFIKIVKGEQLLYEFYYFMEFFKK